MRQENKLDVSSFLTGIITGVVVSGVTTLLFTPASGKNVRKKTVETYESLYRKSQEIILQINSVTEHFKRLIHVSKQEFAPTLQEIQNSISIWRKDAEKHQELIKKQIIAIEEPLKELERAFEKREN